jgi:DNA-directed RNA polymerase specialized sigma24 family protein
MASEGSVTCWLRRLQAGDQAALQQLWQGYFRRLVGLARQRLHGFVRRAADEEDVALSAFDSFHRGVEAGRFPRLLDRNDLWQVLVLLTRRKAANLANHERAQKRGGGRVQVLSALPASEEDEGPAFANLISREPDPAFAVAVADECRRLLELLKDPELRSVAQAKMEGDTNEEIALKVSRSVPTVERKLRLIRDTWEKEADHE